MKHWTESELNYLRQNSSLPDREIAGQLGRTKSSVQHARTYHNIPGKKRRPIKQREIDFVTENTDKMSDSELGEALGRSPQMICRIRCKTSLRRYYRFSSEEIVWLIKNYPELGTRACAKSLKRPYDSVRQKIYELRKTNSDLYWEPSLNLEKIELAYLAGIIDGEGSFHAGLAWSSGRPNIGCTLNISNTSPELKLWLKERLNSAKFRVSFSSNLPCYRCDIRPPYLQKLIETVLPYLVIKKNQAKSMLHYLRLRERHRRDSVSKEEILLIREIRKLNFHHKEGSKTYQQYFIQERRIDEYLEFLEGR